jgi:hypothetical protein
MKKLLLVPGFVAALALGSPVPAHAHFSLAIGLPGFGIFVHEPCPRPIVYAPPVYYPPRVVYYPYAPAPVVFHPRHGHHRGWYRHRPYWDD